MMEAAHVKKPRDQGTSGRLRLRTGGRPLEERRPVGDTLATRMRKKTRVDYSEVDYSGVEAIGMEVEIAVAVKDNGKKPKVGNTAEKKTGVKEKSTDHKKMKEGKGKQCKKEVKKELKGGKGKTSVNKKKKGEMKVRDCGNKENNNDENHEEEHTGGEILQENKSQEKRVYSQELKKKIAERAVKIGNCAEVGRQFSKELGYNVDAGTVRYFKRQMALCDVTKGNRGGKKTQKNEDNAMSDGEEADMVTEGSKEGENTQGGGEEVGEGNEVNVGVGLHQVEKRMKEKELAEKPEISLVLDTHPRFEETPLSAGCMKIRVLEMKSRELERKKRLLELEEEANAQELEAEKEKLKTTLEESIRSKKSG